MFLGIVLFGVLSTFGLVYYHQPGPLSEEKIVIIPPHTGTQNLAILLSEKGVIRHPLLFMLTSRIMRGNTPLYAGEYLFLPHMPPKQILQMLKEHKIVIHKFTVPEGYTTTQILKKLQQEPSLTGEVPSFLPEGTLLPETYFYTLGDKRLQLIEAMQHKMQLLLDELLKHLPAASTLPLSPQEVVTLASIVEKETGIAEERPRVASVFLNRLRLGMRLQSDPTVAYGITGGKYELSRALLLADLKTYSPYNTYMMTGLPPAPICNPGKASLLAVIYPENSQFLYFVANGKGGHLFAKTLEEHNRNVLAYRKFQQQNSLP